MTIRLIITGNGQTPMYYTYNGGDRDLTLNREHAHKFDDMFYAVRRWRTLAAMREYRGLWCYYEGEPGFDPAVLPTIQSMSPSGESQWPLFTAMSADAWYAQQWQFDNQLKGKQVHPLVKEMLIRGYVPANMAELVAQWPHEANDKSNMAWTPSEEYAKRDRVMTCTVGRYLTRHFPKAEDHVIRDLVHLSTANGISIVATSEQIVGGVQNGPRSCMKWSDDELDEHDNVHPYEAYSPEFGWRMALRKTVSGKIIGRALILLDDPNVEGKGVYVRSYYNEKNDDYSEPDHVLDSWLPENGYRKRRSWPDGSKLARLEDDNLNAGVLVPYLDGDNKYVIIRSHGPIVINKNGHHKAESTEGEVETREDMSTCSHCDNLANDDDGFYRGDTGEFVGACCASHYTEVIGLHGNETWLPEDSDDIVRVGSRAYHRDYLKGNGVVEVGGDGDSDDFAMEHDCTQDGVDGYWYRDRDVVETVDAGWCSKDNAWKCEASGDWYSILISSATDSLGQEVHPDVLATEEEQARRDQLAHSNFGNVIAKTTAAPFARSLIEQALNELNIRRAA